MAAGANLGGGFQIEKILIKKKEGADTPEVEFNVLNVFSFLLL
jgi:hypothetical protein